MKQLIILFFFLPTLAFAQTDSDTILIESFEIADSNSIGSFNTANKTLIDSLLDYAHHYLGVKYQYAGIDSNGFDCSGFVCHVYGAFGYHLPRNSGGQAIEGKPIKRDDIQPGDILYFKGRSIQNKRVGHVGIAIKNEDGIITFIHASVNYGISTATTASGYYKPRYLGARRVIKD